MGLSEFDLIGRYFSGLTKPAPGVAIGIGDDCAVLNFPANKQLAVSMDTLVSGCHFLADTDPEFVGHKALAVNLSDLAAMGAEPAWATLALTLPEVDHHWLSGFSRGFANLAKQYGVQLVGGDTTRGPLSITIQIQGFVDPEAALTRAGARVGDKIFVSGKLGDAGLGLLLKTGAYKLAGGEQMILRLDKPEPRIALGMALPGIANAAIDISDGLFADLGHICGRSKVGALLHYDLLPCSDEVRSYAAATGDRSLPLSAGDDYELCFTVPENKLAAVQKLQAGTDFSITCIGEIISVDNRVQVVDAAGLPMNEFKSGGYDHFS